MDLLQPVRGTADLLPEDKARHNYVVSVAQNVARRSGFQDMATPVFEFTQVFRFINYLETYLYLLENILVGFTIL